MPKDLVSLIQKPAPHDINFLLNQCSPMHAIEIAETLEELLYYISTGYQLQALQMWEAHKDDLMFAKDFLLHYVICSSRLTEGFTYVSFTEKNLAEIVESLLASSANPDILPQQGCSRCVLYTENPPLLYLAAKYKRPKVVASLSQYGANWNFLDEHRNNLLHLLLQKNYFTNFSALKILLNGIKNTNQNVTSFINHQNAQGETPLHSYLRCYDRSKVIGTEVILDIVRLLLQYGTKSNLKTTEGKTLLYLAIDYVETIDPYSRDSLFEQKLPVLKELILAGNDLHEADHNGTTPYSLIGEHRTGHRRQDILQAFNRNYLEAVRAEENFPDIWDHALLRTFSTFKETLLADCIKKPTLKEMVPLLLKQFHLYPILSQMTNEIFVIMQLNTFSELYVSSDITKNMRFITSLIEETEKIFPEDASRVWLHCMQALATIEGIKPPSEEALTTFANFYKNHNPWRDVYRCAFNLVPII